MLNKLNLYTPRNYFQFRLKRISFTVNEVLTVLL
jgi:hypothetical protein